MFPANYFDSTFVLITWVTIAILAASTISFYFKTDASVIIGYILLFIGFVMLMFLVHIDAFMLYY